MFEGEPFAAAPWVWTDCGGDLRAMKRSTDDEKGEAGMDKMPKRPWYIVQWQTPWTIGSSNRRIKTNDLGCALDVCMGLKALEGSSLGTDFSLCGIVLFECAPLSDRVFEMNIDTLIEKRRRGD